MDALPPNDPNGNRPPHGGGGGGGNGPPGNAGKKEAPYDGQSNRRSQRDRANQGNNANNGPMDILGYMQDSPVVAAMLLFGLIHWLMRERCIC